MMPKEVAERERNLLLQWLRVWLEEGVYFRGVDLGPAVSEAIDILTPGE